MDKDLFKNFYKSYDELEVKNKMIRTHKCLNFKKQIFYKIIMPLLNDLNENCNMDFNFNDDEGKNYIYIELNNPYLIYELVSLLEAYRTEFNIGYQIDLVRYCINKIL